MPHLFRFLPLLCLLAMAGWAYFPGLTGAFLLDDFENLKLLGLAPPGSSWPELLSFTFSQYSGATRLLPQLSFALQADAWPAQPGRMILVNIVLHLANGLLVYFLATKLVRLAGLPRPGQVGLLAAAAWLLSPLQVSGVLYVIQRINQIAAFFVFAGAFFYLHGRERFGQGGLRPLLWMVLGVVGCGGLAVLGKENGVLLPLLLLTAEITLLPAAPDTAINRWSKRLLLYAPLLLLALVLVWQSPQMLAGYEKRDFGLAGRLFAQPGILLDYAQRFLLPRGAGLGLFHDDYPAAEWPPDAATLSLVLVFAAMLLAALALRRRWRLASFGVLWFVAGHALEASHIPLELYFEHRNYVPLFGPAVALAGLGVAAIDKAGKEVRLAVIVLIAGWLLVATGVTYSQAVLWGQPDSLIEVWLHDHPRSPRALGAAATSLAQQGFDSAARRRMEELTEGPLARGEYYGQWLQLSCDGRIAQPSLDRVAQSFSGLRYATLPVNALSWIADRFEERACPALRPADMLPLVRSLERNPAYRGSRINLQTLAGRFLELAGRNEEALAEIGAAFKASGNPEHGFIELRLLASLGRSEEASRKLAALEQWVNGGGMRFARYRADIERWQRTLQGGE